MLLDAYKVTEHNNDFGILLASRLELKIDQVNTINLSPRGGDPE